LTHTQDLISKAKQNDEQAIEELIQYYFPLIKSVVNKFSSNLPRDLYDDLVQEGKILFIELLNRYNPQLSNFGFYIKNNFERYFFQKFSKRYYSAPSSNISECSIADSHDIFSRINLINDLNNAIEQLPTKQQLAVKLYYVMDLQQEQCAQYLSMKQPAFSRLLSRALKNIKKNLAM
jgi:RNA polymerase sigma factor (sigma-70 family)